VQRLRTGRYESGRDMFCIHHPPPPPFSRPPRPVFGDAAAPHWCRTTACGLSLWWERHLRVGPTGPLFQLQAPRARGPGRGAPTIRHNGGPALASTYGEGGRMEARTHRTLPCTARARLCRHCIADRLPLHGRPSLGSRPAEGFGLGRARRRLRSTAHGACPSRRAWATPRFACARRPTAPDLPPLCRRAPRSAVGRAAGLAAVAAESAPGPGWARRQGGFAPAPRRGAGVPLRGRSIARDRAAAAAAAELPRLASGSGIRPRGLESHFPPGPARGGPGERRRLKAPPRRPAPLASPVSAARAQGAADPARTRRGAACGSRG
jgi:hypothetical protein